MHDLLDTKTAAPCIGVSPGTLENWRVRGIGPKFIKTFGRRGKVLYDPSDIEAWKEANRYQSTSDAILSVDTARHGGGKGGERPI